LRRVVQGFLNKVAPENLAAISRQVVDLQLETDAEMVLVVEAIVEKAVRERHYCATYSDILLVLSMRWSCRSGTVFANFTDSLRKVVSACWKVAVEEARTSRDDGEVRKKGIGTMQLVGQMFLRDLVDLQVIKTVLSQLTAATAEMSLELASELITTTGHTLSATTSGNAVVASACKALASARARNQVSKRLQVLILDMMDLRASGWQRKLYHDPARRIGVCRQAMASPFVVVVAGERPDLGQVCSLGREEPSEAVQVCRSFQLGRCKRGYKCKFLHDRKGAKKMSSMQAFLTAKPSPPSPCSDRKHCTSEWSADEETQAATDDDSHSEHSDGETLVDEAALRRMITYFGEDGNKEALVAAWEAVVQGPVEEQAAVLQLLHRGFGEVSQGAKNIAKVMCCLWQEKVLSAASVDAAMKRCLKNLDDILLDNPAGGKFYQLLMAYATLAGGCAWVLKPLREHPSRESLAKYMSPAVQRTLLTVG